jgi:hypothetical protein
MIPGRSPVPVFDPSQTEQLETAIRARIGELADPLERSQALERLALTKLRAGDFEGAHTTLQAAADATLEAPMGLRRDLRLIQLNSVLLDVASAQVIEGLSNNPFRPQPEPAEPPPLGARRSARLDQARAEWQLAYRLAAGVRSEDYRSEQQARVARSEAAGSQSIARAGLRGTLLPQTFDLPQQDMMTFADELLVEASGEASKIARVVWRNLALIDVAGTAAKSMQLARARVIAQSIADPASRSQALIRTAESLVGLATRVENDLPRFLDDAWTRYQNAVALARTDLQTDLDLERMSSVDEAAFALSRKVETLETLEQAAVGLDQRVQLVEQLVHNARVARAGVYPGPNASVPLRRAADLEAALDRVLPRTAALRDQARKQLADARAAIQRDLDAARTAGARTLNAEQDPFPAIAGSLPNPDDPAWTEVGNDLNALARATVGTARNAIVPEATEVYQAAAQAVAEVASDDPRNDTATVLITSLIAVNRFDDARAAVGLLSNASRQILSLGEIAEAQGRRGLAESAYAWIDRDVPAQYHDLLYRHVEAGVLATVDENRLRRSMIAPIR